MLPELPPEIRAAQALGISMFAGEAENRRLDQVLLDAWRGELAPLYDFMNDLPALDGEPAAVSARRASSGARPGISSSIDLGRGCPYQCSFCTIINVQGRKSRYRTPDDLEQHRARQLRPGHPALLHHRRQFRAQSRLGRR